MPDTVPGNTSSPFIVTTNALWRTDIDTAGDTDWFRITLTERTLYQFEALGSNFGQGHVAWTLTDPLFTLRDAAGNIIASAMNDDGGLGLNARAIAFVPTTGTYFVDIGSANVGIGTTGFIIQDNLAEGIVSHASAVTGSLTFDGDQDYWTLNAVAGTRYSVSLTGITLANPFLEVYAGLGTGVAIAFNGTVAGSGSNTAYLSFISPVTGSIAIGARGAWNSLQTGTYTLLVYADVVANDITTQRTINDSNDRVRVGSIDAAGDSDWFRITLTAGTKYQFDLRGTAGEGASVGGWTLADPELTLHNSAGAQLTLNDDGGVGANARVTFTPTTTGDYFLAARSHNPGATGSYKLVANEATTIDSSVTSGFLHVGGTPVAQAVDAVGDIDNWGIDLVAGVQYRVSLAQSAGSSLNPYVEVLDSSGIVIESFYNDNTVGSLNGVDALLLFTPSTNGIHLIEARASDHQSTGGYVLRVDVNDGIRGDITTTATIGTSSDRVKTGTIDAVGDSDWYKVSLNAGQLYQFDLAGSEADGVIGGLMLRDPELFLYDSTGTLLVSDDDRGVGFNARISFTALASGNYFLDVRSHAPDGTGSYKLVANNADVIEAAGSANPLTVGGTPVIGDVDSPIGDIDNWSISLVAGTTYRISLDRDTTVAGNTLNPFLEILDPTGEVVEQNFDDDTGPGSDSMLIFTPSTSGVFLLEARASNHASVGRYKLGIVDVNADTTPPTVMTFNPTDGATNVPVASNIVVTFSEAIQRGTGSIVLRNADGTAIETYEAASSPRLTLAGAVLTVDPSANLASGTGYRLEFDVGSLQDLSGNSFGGSTAYNFTTVTIVSTTPTPGDDVLTGTSGPDIINALAGHDAVNAGAGNDRINAGAGNDNVDGGPGIDWALYSTLRTGTALSKTTTGYTVTSEVEGIDALANVERLQFIDIGIALDVGADQSAGQTVLLLGAALPGQLVFDESKQVLLGAVIDLFDAGYSLRELSGALLRLPVWDVLTGQAIPTNRDIANYLLTNVNGGAPGQATLDAAVNALNTEVFQGDWFAGLAGSAANQLHVGLVGLMDTGLEFMPLAQP